jgi:hypothetical protein
MVNEKIFHFTLQGRRQVGTSRARAKQVPVVGCLPGPISIFFHGMELQVVFSATESKLR